MTTKSTLLSFKFLCELCVNNNREWFNSNRDKYLNAKQEFTEVVEYLIEEVKKFDNNIKDVTPANTIFRIFKDSRFSRDKIPYKNNFGAYIVSGGKKFLRAGYYFHIEPDRSFVAGGIYMPTPDILLKIRTAIMNNPKEYRKIINAPKFKELFGGIYDEPMKSPPRGFDKNADGIELIKYKNFGMMKYFSDKEIVSPDILTRTLEIFKQMKNYNDFINKAIG